VEHQEERDVCAAELVAAPEPANKAPVAVAATEEDPTIFESRARGEYLVAKLTIPGRNSRPVQTKLDPTEPFHRDPNLS